MATVYATLGLLRDEVEARVVNLTPTAIPTTRFVRRPLRDRAIRDFAACTGKGRLVELGMGTGGYDTPTIGHTARRYEYRLPLQIMYQDTPEWRRAALDDADRIAQDLREHYSAAPSGVQIRHIDTEEQPTIEPHEDDPWFVLSLTVYAMICVEP